MNHAPDAPGAMFRMRLVESASTSAVEPLPSVDPRQADEREDFVRRADARTRSPR